MKPPSYSSILLGICVSIAHTPLFAAEEQQSNPVILQSVEIDEGSQNVFVGRVADNKNRLCELWNIQHENPRSTFKVPATIRGIYVLDYNSKLNQLVLAGVDESKNAYLAFPNTRNKFLRMRIGNTSCRSIQISPDGKMIAAAESRYNGDSLNPHNCFVSAHPTSISFFDTKQGNAIAKFEAHSKGINCVCFSPDGKNIVSSSNDNFVKIWCVDSQKVLLKIPTPSPVKSILYDNKGEYLAGAVNNEIFIWKTSEGNLVKKLRGHCDRVSCLSFNPESNQLASGSYDKSIRIWDIDSGQELKNLRVHDDLVIDLKFSATGKFLVSAGWDGMVNVLDGKNWKIIRTFDVR